MIGAGDMGRDCSPSPVHSAPSLSTQHSGPREKKKTKLFFLELDSLTLNGDLVLVTRNG
jgi:hypothetical protein